MNLFIPQILSTNLFCNIRRCVSIRLFNFSVTVTAVV